MQGANEHALSLLAKLAQGGSVPHALLFTGSDETFKKDVANTYIRHLLHKDQGNFEYSVCKACVCESCHLISRNLHPDFTSVDDDPISIERVRDLKHKFAKTPLIGSIKSAIISAADSMRAEAANALLKLLEEPEGNALFILLAKSRLRVLPTIASRALEIRFAKFSPDFSEQSSLRVVEIFEKGSLQEKFFEAQGFTLKNKRELLKILDDWMFFLRKNYLCKVGGKTTANKAKKILRLKQIIATTNASPQLLLEELFVSLN